MSVQFIKAKNGSLTCTINSKQYHSAYNPENEAKSFVSNLNLDYAPSSIFIIEPGLSYCAEFLRKRFPEAKIYAIRITKDFLESDKLWDYVFYPETDFSDKLYTFFGEEVLLTAAFFSWPASQNFFKNENDFIWKEIKEAIVKSRTVLLTRSHFAKKWFFNSIRFFSTAEKIVSIEKVQSDILVAASGPSLSACLPFIKKNRTNFFLMAVSSALSPLIKAGITPDLVISTDGGFWAKFHLLKCNTVYCLTDESAVPSAIFNTKKILPAYYENSLGEKLFSLSRINAVKAFRNGTVSGTAALLALTLTDKNVYFLGLDQAPAKGFQHTCPNILEIRSSALDSRLSTKEKRLTASRFNSSNALEIYRNWFISTNLIDTNRFFRLSNHYEYQYSLGKIKELNIQDIRFNKNQNPENLFKDCNKNFDKQSFFNRLQELTKTELFKNELFPLEQIQIKRAKEISEVSQIEEKIAAETEKILNKAGRLLK